MQKPTKRFLSMLVALALIVAMVPAAVFAEGETDVLEGWNIALGDNIGVNFRLNSADYNVTATVNGAAVTPTISENVATVNVAAAQMNDPIVLTVKSGEETVHTGEYSVRQYANTILTGEYDDEVKSMVKEMLNYGAAAQTYFAYNADNLANSGVTVENVAVPTDVPEVTVTDDLDGIDLYGMSLIFRNKTAVRFYFNVSGNIADFTFSQGTPVEKDGHYYVEIDDINPQDLANDIALKVNDGALSVTYSPLNYIVRKYNNANSSEELKALVQAMYGYHLEALEYVKYQQIIQVGVLNAHAENTWSADGIYASASANSAAYNSDWSVEYKPVSADVIKLVRGGVTTSVGIPESGTLVKYSESEYYLKTAAWTISGSVLPLQDQDYLIVEGRFTHETSGTTIQIAKTYIYNNGGNLEFSSTEPILPTTIDAGIISKHSVNGWASNGVYGVMAENDAPYDGWSVEYTPVAAENLKLIRNGETYNIGIPGRGTLVKYNATDYFLKMEWNVGDYAPMQDGDVLIVEGGYVNEASKVTLNISKTYIYANGSNVEFSTEMPTLPSTVEGGTITSHSNTELGAGGLYFTMAANDAPYNSDWTLEYTQTSVDGIKRIRDGVETSIGIVGRPLFLKYSETEYYLKLENWTLGDNATLQANDILVIEGDFYNEASKTTLNISKSYIYYDGNKISISTEMPTLPTTVEGGVMQSHANGMSGTGIYFKLDVNDAPYEGWSIEYKQTATSNIKLIRNGATNDIGIVDRPLLIKYSDTEYFLKLEEWTVGSYGINSSDPITTDDVLIIEGGFVYDAEKVTLNITKSYVYYDGSAWICSATLPVEVDCGVMSEHADGSPSEIYFSMVENSVPVDENAETAYAGSVQLVSGGNVTSVNANIYKLDEGYYYLELDGAELADQSYLIVEGAFANSDNGYTMNITKTYVLNDGSSLVYSTTEPVLETEYALTGLTNHSNGWTADGIYISHDAHEATYNSDWSVEYKPVSAKVIKLVRKGVTTSIGQPASGTLVVYSATDMYLKTAAWTIQGDVLPFVDGDQIIIEGKFKHEASGSILVAEKTVICVNGSDLIFNPVFAGTMTNHSNGAGGDGVYATMAANDAAYVTDWSTEFSPLTADAYRVIRDGVETNIGISDRGTLVKYGETDYYLKTSGWCLDTFAATTSDILVIDGFWKSTANNTILKIEKTYLYYDGSAWVFSTILPTVVEGGVMQTHESGMSGNGIYFKLDANDAPYNSDWSLEYKQTSVDNIKLIRDGVTTSIGIVDRPMFVRINETDHYLKLEGWTIGDYAPITTDDVLVIEGNFEYADQNVTLNISKSYVYYDGTAWVCSAEAPASLSAVDVVELGKHSNGWTSGGFYFTAAANDAPFNTDWSLRYVPVSADAIKLINADGSTTNVGNTGAETIVKYSETDYYVEGWAVGSANMTAGTNLVIEGQFYNEANDTYIDVEKTYFTFNEGGTVTVISDSDKYINAGAMGAYTSNWFGDGIYFALADNIAPAAEDWTVRYTPAAVSNIKLIRNGETVSIANTGAESIVKIADGQYWLSLESWWWSAYAPIQDGDVLVIEGEFANASNGYTLSIEKTYITFVSKDNDDVQFSTVADTAFGEIALPNSTKTLNIGMWNGSHHVFNDARLAELKAAGITKIMGVKPEYTGAEYGGITGMLDRAANYGISVIVDLRDWDGTTVPDYVNHSALIGFLMYDEPCATDFDTLASLKESFDAVMPEGTLFYVNLYPSCAAGTSLVGSVDWALGKRDYDTYYVQKFLDKLGVEVLSWDNYSLLDGSGIRTDYFYNFEVMASKTGVEKWYTMLSAGHGTTSTSYATPTAEELRWQMAVAMTYGVSNIDHYTYTSHESGYSCMLDYNTETVTDLYYDIKDVDNEYLAWDNIYMAYDWQGVGFVDVGDANEMLTKLNNELTLADNGLAAADSTSQDLLIGVFQNNGNKAYMVTNIGTPNSSTVGDGKGYVTGDTTVTLTLGEGSYKCVAVIDQGKISYVAVNADNTVSIDVEAYEGVFVIPVLN